VTAAATGLILVACAAAALYFWYGERARRLATDRLAALLGTAVAVTERDGSRAPISTTFPPRHPLIPAALGALAIVAIWLVATMPFEVSAASGLLIGVLAYLVEDFLAEQRIARIEGQLAEAIDLLVGSLRAGASLLAAFDSSLEETGPPLRSYFQEVAGRIRLGDDPRLAVGDLPRHIPLETFRLFAASLAVHWEVGGSLAATLTTVGRTIRDRIELSRRVRAQGIEAHASVGVVLVLAYVLGYLMWRANPDRLEAFVKTGVGTELVAAVIGLQAFGLVWMSRISRSSF